MIELIAIPFNLYSFAQCYPRRTQVIMFSIGDAYMLRACPCTSPCASLCTYPCLCPCAYPCLCPDSVRVSACSRVRVNVPCIRVYTRVYAWLCLDILPVRTCYKYVTKARLLTKTALVPSGSPLHCVSPFPNNIGSLGMPGDEI